MAYNLGEIVARVQQKLDDTDYSTQIIKDFINDTQQEIFNGYNLPFNQETFSGVIASGEHQLNFVSSATDYQRVVGLRITSPTVNETDLSGNYVPYRQFRKLYPDPSSQTAGIPYEWTTWGFVIYFSRPTDQEYTMDMDYIKEATIIEDDADVPELPASWQEVLVLGAFIRALERNDDNDIAEYHRSKQGGYLDQIQTLAGRYNPAQTTATTTMGQSRRFGGVGRYRR